MECTGERAVRAVLLEPSARVKQAQAVAEPLKKAPCVPARCAKLSGRSLEPFSDERPRGMTVTAVTPYRIRLIGSTSLAALIIGNDGEGFQFGEILRAAALRISAAQTGPVCHSLMTR